MQSSRYPRAGAAALLTVVLAIPLPAQNAPAPAQAETPAAPQAAMIPSLKVLVLQGQGAVNNIKSGAVTPPIVEVRDENDRPVEGAEVVFRLRAAGPGGLFPDGRATYRTRTNSQGQAACARYTLSPQPGKFPIQVTATFENKVGQTTIEQTNSTDEYLSEPVKRGRSWKRWIIYSAIGGGGAAALAFALRGDSTPGAGTTFTVTPGPIAVGPPR